MPAVLSPTKLLKLWKRIDDRFGFEEDAKTDKKKQSPKVKAADKENIRIEKGLTRLRNISRGNMDQPSTAAKFEKSRNNTAKSLKKYCKLLKSNDLKKEVQDLTKLRKAVKQLTILVESLKVEKYDEDEGDVDLNVLTDIDTTALDQAMQDPNFGEYSDAELDADEEEEQQEEKEEPSTTQTSTADDMAAFTARLKNLMPAIQKVQVEQTPTAQEVKLAVSEANVFVRKKDFAKANALLDKVETLLKKAAPTEGKAEKSPSLVVLQQTRLAWDTTRKSIQAELKKLEKSILAACAADEEVGVGNLDVGILNTVLQRLDTRLIDKLDEALNAEDPTKRAQLNQEAKGIVNEYMAFVNENPLMAEIDDSGFVPVSVRKTAISALSLLSSKL